MIMFTQVPELPRPDEEAALQAADAAPELQQLPTAFFLWLKKRGWVGG